MGRIHALQLDYTDAYTKLMQSSRKAPQNTAMAFQRSAQKLIVIVQVGGSTSCVPAVVVGGGCGGCGCGFFLLWLFLVMVIVAVTMAMLKVVVMKLLSFVVVVVALGKLAIMIPSGKKHRRAFSPLLPSVAAAAAAAVVFPRDQTKKGLRWRRTSTE